MIDREEDDDLVLVRTFEPDEAAIARAIHILLRETPEDRRKGEAA